MFFKNQKELHLMASTFKINCFEIFIWLVLYDNKLYFIIFFKNKKNIKSNIKLSEVLKKN
jgi:hypothetical protein